MKAWAKIFLTLTLACYLIVSSIAATHAAPLASGTAHKDQISGTIMSSTKMSAMMDTSGDSEMMPNCHQGKSDRPETNSLSTCQIFCAAMSNLIVDELVLDLTEHRMVSKLVFIPKLVRQFALAVDPHPPKQT